MKIRLQQTLFVSLFLFFADVAESFGVTSPLFIIERSLDKNQIHYVLNCDSKNRPDAENPILVYWLKRTQGNKTEALSWMQSHYGYGIKYVSKTPTSVVFQFAAYSKRNFELRKDQNGIYRVFMQSGKGEIVVNRLFVHNDGGTFMKPKISEVDIYGIKLQSGEIVTEILKF